MGIVPENTFPRIMWYRTRLAKWAENFAEIGVSEEEVALLEEKIAAADAKLKQQRMAQSVARSATLSLHQAMDELSVLGASMIGKIRATASMEGRGVYPKALMPPPADPSPIGAPGKPERFKTNLRSDGSLELKWRCKNPKGSEGTIYRIERKIGYEGVAFEQVGLVGKKRFVDELLPAGASVVIYRVTALRSTRMGATAEEIVHLGVDPAWATAKAKFLIARERRLAA